MSVDKIAREIIINVVHNFTNINRVDVLFFFEDVKYEHTWQKIRVKFVTEAEINGRISSGNLGYRTDARPVIVSKLIHISDKDSPRILSYFNETVANTTLKLPKTKNGICTLDTTTFDQINFNENTMTRCNVLYRKNLTAESNFTEICMDFQSTIFGHLLNGHEVNATDLNLFVSEFGNPVNKTKHWPRMKPRNFVNENITASFSDSGAFTCRQMIINLKYHFYFAKLTVGSVRHQFLIKGGDVIFGPRVDLQFNLDEDISVPIFIQVQFFDLTSTSSSPAVTSAINGGLVLVFVLLCVMGLL
jgi:B9 domain-containing protein 2/tectonic-1/3